MRSRLLAASILFLGMASACSTAGNPARGGEQASSQAPAATLALVNGTLIDGTGREPVLDAVIVIDGERIVSVGTHDQVSIPPDTPVIDVHGATLLPGFINAHVHRAYSREALEAWAQSGVTTVRDLENVPEALAFKNEVSQDPHYARLVAAGPMLTVPGGYGNQPVESPEDARQTVNTLLDSGADLIKIGLEDDLQGREWVMPSEEIIRAVVEAAHARHVPVSAHISRTTHLALALDTGVDDVAHMVIDELPDDLITRMVENDMYWEPTLELWKCVSDQYPLNWDAQAIDNLRRFSEAGGKVALGTDYSGFTCDFDLGMPVTEISLMIQAGMTPMQIIVAATHNAAHVSNLDGQVGTLEAGRMADILVVASNPLEDIRALEDVQMVIHGGAIIRE